MRKFKFVFVFLFLCSFLYGQNGVTYIQGERTSDVPPLKNLKPVEVSKLVRAFDDAGNRIWPAGVIKPKAYRNDEPPAPEGYTDPVLQKNATTASATSPDMVLTGFEGQATSSGVYDPSICVGPNHVIQLVNGPGGTSMQIWNKNGTLLQGPFSLQQLSGTPGNGDPIALYDQQADRFILTEFIIGNGTTARSGMSILVSKTNDPTLGFFGYRWLVPENFLLDYPKWAVGPNGLYLHTNNYNLAGSNYLNSFFAVMNKQEMYSGNQAFRSMRLTQSIGDPFSTCPAQVQGNSFPAGGQLFVSIRSTGTLIECTPNWTLNTFTQTNRANISLGAFSTNLCDGANDYCVHQPFGGIRVQALTKRIMNQPIIRVLPDGSTGMVYCFTVNAGNNRGGVRWVELKNTGGAWFLNQQATWHPNTVDHHFMGSMAYDAQGNMGLLYNTGGTGTFLSLRYTGRRNCDGLGYMSLPEASIKEGNGINNNNRWGDYNHAVADPDGQTIWMTGMYARGDAAGGRGTYIARVNLNGTECAAPTGLSASDITPVSANLSWAPVNNAYIYRVEYKPVGTADWSEAGFTYVFTNTASISVLNPGTVYDWRVSTICLNACSASPYTQSQFSTGASSCSAPVTLNASGITSNGAFVNWSAASGAVSYTVEYKPVYSSVFSFAGTTTATGLALSGLLPATVYDWRVKTSCGTGVESGYNQAQFTTTAGGACSVPVNNYSYDACGYSVVFWDAVAGAFSYTVEYKSIYSAAWIVYEAATINTYSVISDVPGAYNWRVRVNCAAGSGDYATSTLNILDYTDPSCTFFRKPLENGIAEKLNNTALKVAPQPANNQVTVSFTAGQKATGILLVHDAKGIRVMSRNMNIQEGYNSMLIDVSALPAGIYFISLNTAKQQRKARLVVE